MKKTTNQTGVTLIELMVVVVLVAIFTFVGIPSYQYVTTTNRMATEMNGFVGDIQFARSEAIKRGYDVSMCASDPSNNQPTTTNPQCLGTSTSNWSSGWVVYTPAFGSTATSVLRIHAALTQGDQLVTNGTSNPGLLTFNRYGFTTQAQTYSLTLGATSSPLANPPCAVLSTVGRIRVGKIQNTANTFNAQNCQ